MAVAVKTFEIRDDAKDEVRNLKLLKQSLTTNKSIALHHALIDHASHYLIIFPRATLGDLWQFLYCGNPPDDTDRQRHAYRFEERFSGVTKGDVDIASALLEQCRDLAKALDFLHTGSGDGRTVCAHMDLKPDNILIYDAGKGKPVGRWKICDFGISALREDEEEEAAMSGSIGDLYSLATLRVRPKRTEATYQPPEVAKLSMLPTPTAKDRRRIGRKGDIWSFGAIFAEVLSFAMKRDTYVKEFRQMRVNGCHEAEKNDYFYSPVEPQSPDHLLPTAHTTSATQEYQLRPAVAAWLKRVAHEASSPRRSIDCWAEVVVQILKVKVDERPTSSRLVKMVEHVYQHTLRARQSKEVICEFVDPKIPPPSRPIPIPPPTPVPTSPDSAISPESDDLENEIGPLSGSGSPNPGLVVNVRRPTFPQGELDKQHGDATPSGSVTTSGATHVAAAPFASVATHSVAAHVAAQVGVFIGKNTNGQSPAFPHASSTAKSPPDSSEPIPHESPPTYDNHESADQITDIPKLPSQLQTNYSKYPNDKDLPISPGGHTPQHKWRRTSSLPSILTPSLILGRPVNAYGIKHNEDRRRRQSPPGTDDYAEVSKLQPLPRGAKAFSVDYVFSEGLQAAYLIKNTISIYRIGQEGHPSIPTSTIALPDGRGHQWSGVALAGDYMAVWGKKKSDETTLVGPLSENVA